MRNPDVNSVVAENNDTNITSGTVVSLKYSRPVVGLITCAKRIGGGSLDWYIIDQVHLNPPSNQRRHFKI